jgi:predicted RNA-binding protein
LAVALRRSELHMSSMRTYWLDLFTGVTWKEFIDAGASVTGFRETRWNTVQEMKQGDYLLCYLTGVSRWIGVLEVISEPFMDRTPIWKDDVFPCRVRVRLVETLTPDTSVSVHDLLPRMKMTKDLAHPLSWTGYFRRSPAKWNAADGELVVQAIQEAARNPVVRPVDQAKLSRRPRALKAQTGSFTVPEDIETEAENATVDVQPRSNEASAHTEVQWLLLQLGSDMGLDVWVARNDRNRSFNGHRFSDIRSVKSSLPLQFDEATNRTIELIDVLWLRSHSIVAAFEIESTTSIYSGLLRMSDLIAMQPNLNIPLYLVAPDERREKVITEVNRPTFSRLSPPMSEMCRYISFSTLRERLAAVKPVAKYLKPEFLDELSESCEVEDP